MSSSAQVASLLEQTGWIRSLARSLASDVHLGDDLAQEAWVAALERPPGAGPCVRGWLATVLRHRLRDLRRERGHREERERAAARHEALPSAHDLVERASIQRELVEAVLELDEPYRTTVLLRFFEELPQREIAHRMQTSTATVNSRLTRALERLRERLSREGGPTAWLQVLVPLLREPPLGHAAAPLAALGVSAMKVAVAVVVAASVLVGIALWRSSSDGAPPAIESPVLASAAPLATAHVESPTQDLQAPEIALDERALVAEDSPAPIASEPAVESVVARILRGRVLDASGNGVAGVALALGSQERTTSLESKSTCTSGAGGWFEIGLDAPAETILSVDPRYATVLAGLARVRDETQPMVVVAPRIEFAGIVVDEAGTPLAGAFVGLRLPAGFGTEWGLALDYSVPQRWTNRSGGDGKFALAAVPAVSGATLHATLGGFAAHSESAPARSDSALQIVMRRPQAADGLVRGVVLDPSGSPVEGARVSAGAEIAFSNRDGEFALDVAREGTLARLIAVKRGALPAIVEPAPGADGKPAWPAFVVLQLGGPSSTIHGRVVDEDGRAVVGAKVWLDDPTHFGVVDELVISAESLLRGDERFWSYELTRPDGTFSIEGLFARAYRLQAVDPRSLASVESPPVGAADSPVELVLPSRDVHGRVAGRVVARNGDPIAGVSVRLYRVTYEVQLEMGMQNDAEEREPALTDERGAFEFLGVPKTGVDLMVSGDTILFAGASLADEPDLERIEIIASRRMHMQVELDEPRDRADRLKVFAADGRAVILRVMRGAGAYADFELPILDGRSAVIALDELAATLVLFRGELEVARMPLHLSLGGTNVVRY